jgi:hypothetical protein
VISCGRTLEQKHPILGIGQPTKPVSELGLVSTLGQVFVLETLEQHSCQTQTKQNTSYTTDYETKKKETAAIERP